MLIGEDAIPDAVHHVVYHIDFDKDTAGFSTAGGNGKSKGGEKNGKLVLNPVDKTVPACTDEVGHCMYTYSSTYSFTYSSTYTSLYARHLRSQSH